ncbi:immunoglobulin-like domain-containing protein [Enterococcus faecium]|uniref:immunoglobulin-like domain-containing protein n=1 Tax=Enterococcus faecium TaxID=1352 RepID=UPI0023B2AD10|nr:immunoglobulin-like domain-containing protein [Enterococcus faecium]
MKNKKLLSIGASSLMLLNAGLAPATALAEENKTEKTEATGEQSSELKNNLAEDPLAKITNGATQSATQQSNNIPASEGTTESATTAQTEESSTVVSSEAEATVGQTEKSSSTDATSGTQTEESSTKVTSDDVKKPEDGSIQTKSIDVLANGTATVDTDTGKPLVIHEKKTEGILNIKFHVDSTLSMAVQDNTYYQVKLPDEFKPLLQDPRFIDYLSGKVDISRGLHIPVVKETKYARSDITVDSNKSTILLKNPSFTTVLSLVLHGNFELDIDLGGFATDTGIRIPNSIDGKYHFATAWTPNNNILDWAVLGNKTDKCDLEYDQLDPAYGTNKPVLTASDRKITLGHEFTGDFALEGVRAFDNEDGDITKDVVIIDGNVDSNKVGNYPVTYKVTDSHGLFATKTINVTVQENKAPEITAENKEIDKGNAFNPLEGVTAYDEEDGDLTSKIDIKSNNVDVNVPGIYSIIYAVTDSENCTTEKDITVTVKDPSGEVTPNDYTIGGSFITGTYEGEVSSLKLYVDDNPISDDPTMDNGRFTFKVDKELIKRNTKVEVVAYNKDHEELDRKPVKVVGEQLNGTITPDTYTIGNQYITGSYTGDVKSATVYINGTALTPGGEFADGHFTYYVGNKIKSGNNVTISAYSSYEEGHVLLEGNVQVTINAPQKQGTITPNAYTIGDSVITGTYTGDVRKAHLFINGNPSKWGGTFENGRFEFYVGNLIKKDDVVTLDACTKNDQVLQAGVPVTITQPQHQGTITPNAYTIGDSVITGTYTGDVRKAHLFINGNPSKWGGNFENGHFEFYVGNLIKKDDVVTLDACTKNDQVLQAKVSVEITQPQYQGTITPDAYTIGESVITGTYTGDVRKAHLFINGRPSKWGGTFENGRFEFYVGNLIKKDDVVTLDACAKNDQVLQAKVSVEITQPQYQGSIKLNKYTPGNSYITGTYTGDVTRAELKVNDTFINTGGTFRNGSFNYYVGGHIHKDDHAKLAAYAPNGKKLDEKTIEIEVN